MNALSMKKKYFKCYLCQTGNSYLVPKNEKGKNCRCCLAYNYFFEKKYHKNNKNKNAYYRQKHFKNYNNHQMNNITHKSNIINNNIQTQNHPFNQTETNITPSYDFSPRENLLNFPGRFVPLNYQMNTNFNKNMFEKKEKYEWLKKEKFTEKLFEKNKEEYECSICLEKLKLNEDITKLKCNHIFHYNCIEQLLEHKDDKCPNCRADLKTGEEQKEKNDIFTYADYILFYYRDILLDDDDYGENIGSINYFDRFFFNQNEFDEGF